MKEYYYDLHIHSCLSPCGDDDMTPNNIAGMGVVAKLDIMALTDHNTCRNCPAFYKTAEANGIVPQTVTKDVREIIEISKKEGEDSRGKKKLSLREREELIKKLTVEMKNAAKILEFEHAAQLRDRIEKLRRGK